MPFIKKKVVPGTVHTIKKKLVPFVDNGPRLEVTIQADNGLLYKVNTGGPGPVRRNWNTDLEKIAEAYVPQVKSEDLLWQEAEKLARMPGERESVLFFTAELELRVEHCKRSIKETGEVVRPFELMDLYWPRPGIYSYDTKTVQRYMELTERVYKYLSQIFTEAEKEADILDGFLTFDRRLKSYRVTMAAIDLDQAILNYARNWLTERVPFRVTTDEALLSNARDAARAYYLAHFIVTKRGPKEMVDPDYITYRSVCRKYGLKVGAILHEVLP